MRLVILAVLVACSATHRTAATRAHAVEKRAPAHGAHGGAIEDLAITEDGHAAVSQDAFGGTRLWPALDGSVEPVAITVPTARELAIARDGDAFAIAAIDAANTLALVRVSAAGEELGHTQPASDVEMVVASGEHLIALRADQTLAVIDLAGRLTGTLSPPPGTTIDTVAARHGRALALVSDKITRGRWIDLATPAWGSETPVLPIDASAAALSPDGKWLLAGTASVVMVELASGRPRLSHACTSRDQDGSVSNGELVGFPDAQTFACSTGGAIAWRGLDGALVQVDEVPDATNPVIAVGDGVTLGGYRKHLVIRTGDGTHYLGYGFVTVSHSQDVGGAIAIDGEAPQALLLDGRLQAHPIGIPIEGVENFAPIDARYSAVTILGPFENHVAVYDMQSHRLHQELDAGLLETTIHYEPATHLLAGVDPEGAVVARLDPKTMLFGKPIHLAPGATSVQLLDPALADGNAIAASRPSGGRIEVEEFRADDLRPSRTYHTVDPVRAIDRAGRAYASDDDALVIDNAAAARATITGARATSVAPSPDARYAAVLVDHQVRLYDVAGKLQWQVAAPEAERVGWVDGAPYVRFAGSIVRLDLATGAFAERSCGWRFELTSLPPADGVGGPSVCDAP